MSTPLPPDRAAYRAAVAAIAAKASAKLPDSLGRIDSAVKLVLAGDVELLPDGGAMVASRSRPAWTTISSMAIASVRTTPGHPATSARIGWLLALLGVRRN